MLHFCTFLLNPHFDLEPDYITRKPLKHRFQLYIVRMEILSTFHTRVEYIYVILPIQTNGGSNAVKSQKPCQKQPLPLETRGPPSNTSMPGPTPLTTQNASSIAVRTSAQLRNKVPIGYNGTLQIHPTNCPFPSTITTKI